jgi:hypothetical protein
MIDVSYKWCLPEVVRGAHKECVWLACRETIKDVLNVQGSLYMVTLFMGVLNSMMVQPVMVAERHVFWRERAAGLYAVLPWSAAQVITSF